MLELSLHILDLLRNSVEAGASQIWLRIDENVQADQMTVEVEDDGRGMSRDQMERALDPFYTTRTTRRVGLGLPLLAAAARQCEGDLKIDGVEGKGTRVTASFQLSHWDRAPLGDIIGTLLAIICTGSTVNLNYHHQVDDKIFDFSTAEIRAELEDIPLHHPKVRGWIENLLTEGEASLRKGPPSNASQPI